MRFQSRLHQAALRLAGLRHRLNILFDVGCIFLNWLCLRFHPMIANDVAGGAHALVQPRMSLARAGIQRPSAIQTVGAQIVELG